MKHRRLRTLTELNIYSESWIVSAADSSQLMNHYCRLDTLSFNNLLNGSKFSLRFSHENWKTSNITTLKSKHTVSINSSTVTPVNHSWTAALLVRVCETTQRYCLSMFDCRASGWRSLTTAVKVALSRVFLLWLHMLWISDEDEESSSQWRSLIHEAWSRAAPDQPLADLMRESRISSHRQRVYVQVILIGITWWAVYT